MKNLAEHPEKGGLVCEAKIPSAKKDDLVCELFEDGIVLAEISSDLWGFTVMR